MALTLKCPNPSCSYLFDPSTVPAGVVLACPRCAMRFTLGTHGAPPPPAHPPQATSSGTDRDFAGMSTSAPRTRKPQLPARGSRLQTALLVLVPIVALAGAAYAVWHKLTHKTDAATADLVSKFKERNLAVEPAPEPWVRDEPTRVLLDSPYLLAYKRDNPEAFIAYGARDYQTREPRPSELRAGLTDALDRLLERNSLEPSGAPPGTSWLGSDVKGFRFRGRLKTGAVVEGEAYAVARQGIAYWFLAWTGENDIYEEQRPEFAAARERARLLDSRKDWTAKESNVVAYKNTVVGYTLLDADGVWKEIDDPKEVKSRAGSSADRMLTLNLGNRKNLQRVGTLIIYVLPSTGDPLAQARRFVTDARTDEVKAAGDYTVAFQERTGSPEGDTIGNVVEATSPVVRLQSTVEGASGQDRLHVISAAVAGEKLVVVHAWCDTGDRAAFEASFVQIAGSLRTN